MECPSCQGDEMKKEVTLKGFLKKTKVITFYCPTCPFINAHEFELSREDYNLERSKKEILIKSLPMRIYNKRSKPPQ